MHRRTLARTLPFVLLLALALWPEHALAQAGLRAGGMDLRLLRPAADSKGLLALDGADILGENALSFGLLLDAGIGLLPFEGFVNDPTVQARDARRTGRLVDVMFTGTLQVNWGIADLLVVGADLPVHVISGPDVTIPDQYGLEGGALEYQGLGGIGLHAKMRFTRPERDALGIAARLDVEFPTASPGEFTGDSVLAITAALIAEWRPIRNLRFAVELGYRMGLGDGATLRVAGRTDPTPDGPAQSPMLDPSRGTDLRYEDLLRFGVGMGWRATQATELALELHGSQVIDAWGHPSALSLEALAGIKVFVDGNSYLLLSGGAGLPTNGFQAPDGRVLVGFVFEPSIGDRDGDGLRDDVDECPDEPEDFDDFSDSDGCPDPDNDRDGILDVDDECPLVPEDRDGDADSDGCPEGGEGDRDGDGILDVDDACPDEAEDLDGWQDQDGCPDDDNDGDRILDVDDLCPDDAEDADGWEDANGCPDPDNDDDRILDVDDDCDDDPEEYNGLEDEDGCPDRGLVGFEGGTVVFFEQIQFARDSAQILPESYRIVSALGAALAGHPELALVEVQGHADDRGSDEYNILLTRDRAAAVVAALVDWGIDGARLRSAGYGERCPAIPGTSQRARDANRRVELVVIRTSEGATFDGVPCPAGRELAPR